MARLKKYVGFYCPDYRTDGQLDWMDIYSGQPESDEEPNVFLTLKFFEITATSVPEARRHLFSLIKSSLYNKDVNVFALIQILFNVANLSDPDNFEAVFLDRYGADDGPKMITIVNENYDQWNMESPRDFYPHMTKHSIALFNELPKETIDDLWYDAIIFDLMIYPLFK